MLLFPEEKHPIGEVRLGEKVTKEYTHKAAPRHEEPNDLEQHEDRDSVVMGELHQMQGRT